MIKKLIQAGAFAAAAAIIVAPSAFAATNTVNPLTSDEWKVETAATGASAQLVPTVEADVEKYGEDVLQLTTSPTDIDSRVEVKRTSTDMTLGQVETLSYDAQSLGGNLPAPGSTTRNPGATAAMRIALDTNGDGEEDTVMVYEPYLSDGQQNNEPVVEDVWTTWDVAAGYVWLTNGLSVDLPAGNAGANLVTFADVKVAFPDAVVLRVGVSAGDYNPDAKFNVDLITINDDVYNFEATAVEPPVPAVPTNKDQCKKNNFTQFKTEDNTNRFKNQGQCVSYVAKAQADAKKAEKNESFFDRLVGLFR